RYRFLAEAAFFKPIPPPSGERDEDWTGMGDALLDHLRTPSLNAAAGFYAGIVTAWQKQEPAAFDSDVAAYRSWLAGRAPTAASRSGWELVFNRIQPFYLGMLLYVAVFLLAVASWLVWPKTLGLAAYRLLLLTLAVHTL